MGDRKQANHYTLLRIIVLILLLAIAICIFVLVHSTNEPSSQVSPLAVQTIDEQFNNLDGEGEIKWYDDFFTWNPRVQSTSYPFITGTVYLHWDDIDTGIGPATVPVPYTDTHLIIELELRGTQVYTQKLEPELHGQTSPGVGVFDGVTWIWIDVESGTYNEYIKGYWIAGDEIIPLQLVRGGTVIQPVTGFVLYREDLTIPQITYLPIVMKDAR